MFLCLGNQESVFVMRRLLPATTFYLLLRSSRDGTIVRDLGKLLLLTLSLHQVSQHAGIPENRGLPRLFLARSPIPVLFRPALRGESLVAIEGTVDLLFRTEGVWVHGSPRVDGLIIQA